MKNSVEHKTVVTRAAPVREEEISAIGDMMAAMGLKLKEIVPWGRSLQEYVGMFGLSHADLDRRILGCADGPASFNAEMAGRGQRVVSTDPIYAFSSQQIQERFDAAFPVMIERASQHPEHYTWKNIRDLAELGKQRRAATERFIGDFENGGRQGRYVAASLPRLPFANQQFELALCSHLLFTYDEHLSFEFHVAAVKELTRVAREVRFYPLIGLDGEISEFLPGIIEKIGGNTVRVDYEFQRGATHMLTVNSR